MIWVHAGTRKTGTTSLQETCAASRDALAGFGLVYPGNKPVHHELIDACKNGSMNEMIDGWQLNRDESLLISTERAEQLDQEEKIKFVDSLSRIGKDISLIIYLRDPVDLAVSSSQQAIKMRSRTYDECCRKPLIWPYRRQLNEWIVAIGRSNLLVRKYERSQLVNQNVIDDVFHAIGHSECIPKLRRVHLNESISMPAALLISEHTKLIRQGLSEQIIGPLLETPGPKFKLPDWSVGYIQGAVAPQLAWLEREFGISFEREPPSFEDMKDEVYAHVAKVHHGLQDSIGRLAGERGAQQLDSA